MMKKDEFLVSEELEDFFKDRQDDEDKVKLMLNFKSDVDMIYEPQDLNILLSKPKKKFKPKVSVMKKNSDKENIF